MPDSPCMTWTVYWTLNLRRLPTLIISALFTGYPECLPPALINSLNSDSDSASPTLCLKPVFEFCLSDLHFVLLKLHMDPHSSDSSLQSVCWSRVGTKLFRAVALQELSLTHLGYGPINLKLGVFN